MKRQPEEQEPQNPQRGRRRRGSQGKERVISREKEEELWHLVLPLPWKSGSACLIINRECLLITEMYLQSSGQEYGSDTWPKKPLTITREPENTHINNVIVEYVFIHLTDKTIEDREKENMFVPSRNSVF